MPCMPEYQGGDAFIESASKASLHDNNRKLWIRIFVKCFTKNSSNFILVSERATHLVCSYIENHYRQRLTIEKSILSTGSALDKKSSNNPNIFQFNNRRICCMSSMGYQYLWP